jgi:hypothetical protein
MARAERFVEDWFSENYDFEGYPSEDRPDPQAQQLAADCMKAAAEQGISPDELIEELGDLADYIHGKIEHAADEHVRRQADKDD